jgi:hypothetical protein
VNTAWKLLTGALIGFAVALGIFASVLFVVAAADAVRVSYEAQPVLTVLGGLTLWLCICGGIWFQFRKPEKRHSAPHWNRYPTDDDE